MRLPLGPGTNSIVLPPVKGGGGHHLGPIALAEKVIHEIRFVRCLLACLLYIYVCNLISKYVYVYRD